MEKGKKEHAFEVISLEFYALCMFVLFNLGDGI